MTDEIYFGESKKLIPLFLEELNEHYPNAVEEFKPAEHRIYGTGFKAKISNKEDYLVFMLAWRWYGCSVWINLMTEERAGEVNKHWEIAKAKYPNRVN